MILDMLQLLALLACVSFILFNILIVLEHYIPFYSFLFEVNLQFPLEEQLPIEHKAISTSNSVVCLFSKALRAVQHTGFMESKDSDILYTMCMVSWRLG